jgi:hypothetical protein
MPPLRNTYEREVLPMKHSLILLLVVLLVLGDLAAGASAIPAWRSEKQQRAHRTLLPLGGNP